MEKVSKILRILLSIPLSITEPIVVIIASNFISVKEIEDVIFNPVGKMMIIDTNHQKMVQKEHLSGAKDPPAVKIDFQNSKKCFSWTRRKACTKNCA
jgi:hypothetical protein